MPKPFTHILITFDSQDQTLLYRASTADVAPGMSLAFRQGAVVVSGTDPNPAKKAHRQFIDVPCAIAYLKRLADLDLNGMTDEDDRTPREQLASYATFEERSGESKIVHPPSALGLKN